MSFNIEEEIAKFESQNNIDGYEKDTALVIMMIKKNKNFIKSRISDRKARYRQSNAMKLLRNSYPNADVKVISRELFKIGIFSPLVMFIFLLMAYLLVSAGVISLIFIIAEKGVDEFFLTILYVIISALFFGMFTDELRNEI